MYVELSVKGFGFKEVQESDDLESEGG